MRLSKASIAAIIFAGATYIALLFWYEWSARTLSPSEVDDYMAVIEGQTQVPGARHDLPALRSFLEQDDGKPVYTVNMYRFHDIASYPQGSGYGGTGEQAYERFSKVMIPLMISRGSHPIYGSNWVDVSNSRWDRIVIVRYRRRRDLVDLFATDDFADASLHKWASLADHDRMLVQAVHIPDGRFLIMIIGLLSGLMAYLFVRFPFGSMKLGINDAR
jgi:hypothetical protein